MHTHNKKKGDENIKKIKLIQQIVLFSLIILLCCGAIYATDSNTTNSNNTEITHTNHHPNNLSNTYKQVKTENNNYNIYHNKSVVPSNTSEKNYTNHNQSTSEPWDIETPVPVTANIKGAYTQFSDGY